MLQTARFKPKSYDRYVDDCLMVWLHGKEKLLQFLDNCNQQHPSIRFTWNSSLDGNAVDFMDLKIGIGEDKHLEYELYQKPLDSGVNVNYISCIPQHFKASVATQQFKRAHLMSSRQPGRKRPKHRQDREFASQQ